jgi:hypothetical protein
MRMADNALIVISLSYPEHDVGPQDIRMNRAYPGVQIGREFKELC